jgi:hypothetical protein
MRTIYYDPPFEWRAAVEFKYLVVAILILILVSLGKALFHLSSSKPGESIKMVKALGFRIGLSVLLFVLLLIAYSRGWIEPHSIR